jgi:hypothetical protein
MSSFFFSSLLAGLFSYAGGYSVREETETFKEQPLPRTKMLLSRYGDDWPEVALGASVTNDAYILKYIRQTAHTI